MTDVYKRQLETTAIAEQHLMQQKQRCPIARLKTRNSKAQGEQGLVAGVVRKKLLGCLSGGQCWCRMRDRMAAGLHA